MNLPGKFMQDKLKPDASVKKLFDIRVNDLDYKILFETISDSIKHRNRIIINYVNANSVRRLRKNADLKRAITGSDIIHSDGIGIWLASKLFKNSTLINRFNFTDASSVFLEECRKQNWKLFLLGSEDEILKKAVLNLNEKYPGIIISGILNGYVDAELPQTIAEINRTNPDILWVGMGTPKQELWIHKNKDILNCTVIQSVGDLITHLAGEKTRGPVIIQKMGLEWMARLIRHPVRYFDRYLIGIPVFLYLTLFQYRKFKSNSGNNSKHY